MLEDFPHSDMERLRTKYLDPDSDYEDDDEETGQVVSGLPQPSHTSTGTGVIAPPPGTKNEYMKDSELDDKMELDHSVPGPSSLMRSMVQRHNDAIDKPFQGPAIMVTGLPAKTWECLLLYIYSGAIRFAPLKSEGLDVYKEFSKSHKTEKSASSTSCSCKSVFRVAKQMEMKDLQMLALDHLRSRLTVTNIVEEIFSKFTSQYEEAMKIELEVLARNWDKIKGTPRFEQKVHEVAIGKHPHAGQVVVKIFRRLGTL